MSTPQVRDIYPLTPLQEGILFHTLMAPGEGLYIDQLAVELAPGRAVDLDRVQGVFEALVERHDVLRTAFIWEGQERPLQLVAAGASLGFKRLDWRTLAAEQVQQERQRLLQTERDAGFDLARPPLLRVAAASLPQGGCQLVITYHHVILDAWSIANLFREFVQAWEQGTASWRRVARFRDHVTTLAAREQPDAQAFWREHLAGMAAPTALDIAAEPRYGRREPGVGAHWLSLTPGQTELLKSAARSMAVTLAALVHAAWGRLLSLYAGVDDVVFGVTLAGRPAERADAADVVGLCINTLPLRLDIDPGAKVGDWIRSVHERLAAVRRHEFTALQKVQQWSGLGSGVPLFHTVMAFENVPGLPGDEASGDTLVRNGSYLFRTNYPVNVMVVPGQTLSLRINHDESLYDGAAVKRCLEHFASLLVRLAGAPERRLRHVGLLDDAGAQAMRPFWLGPQGPYPERSCIHHLFEQRAREAPERIAFTDGRNDWTYAWLDAHANGLARRLRELGAGPERRVAVYAHRSMDLLVAVLAIHKSGAVYTPLDPMYPAPRIAKMLQVCKPALLLHSPGLREGLPPLECPELCLDGRYPAADAAPACGVHPDNAAYVIFTSGSSGVPKGIELAHRGLCNMLPDWNRLFGMQAGDRLLQFASISFDASVWEIYSALIAGATLCLASRSTLFSADELLGALRELRVSHALLPPSLLGSMNPEDLPQLRCVAAIGERCTNDITTRWSAGRRFYNAYGPAEATITDCVFEADARDIPAGDPPIGRPMSNVNLYALDAYGRPAALGVAGELAIGGVNVARGYIGQPAATAEKFVPDPYAGVPGARMYRTGDQVVIRSGGNFQFLGRKDFQVKIRGVRIELGEVEDALRQHPDVRDAVVLARDHGEGGDKRLVGYVVRRDSAPSAPELRAFLRERVAEAMVPASFVVLDALPISPNGKIDRSRLPEPQGARAGDIGAWREPGTELERRLAAVWAKVLKLDKVGLDDNYFDLGGDSVISIRIVAAAQREGLDITPRDIFEHQTIGALAAACGPSPVAEAAPAAHVGPVPALPMQQRFLESMGDRLAHYNQSVMLRLESGVDRPTLQAALQALQDRHDALRLAAERGADGTWQLRVRPPGMPVVLQAAARDRQLGAAMASLQRSLDPAHGRMFGALWIEAGQGMPASLLLAVHHLAVDAVSWGVLLDELSARCLGESVAAAAASFVPVAAALREAVAAGHLQARLEAWQAVLRDGRVAAADLAAGDAFESSVQRLPAAETSRLLDSLKGASNLGDMLLAALSEVFGPGTLVDLESSGREMPELPARLGLPLGWFTGIAPFALPQRGCLDAQACEQATQARLAWEPGAYAFLALMQAEPAVGSGPRSLRAAPPRRLLVNWLGRLGGLLRADAPFRFAAESPGPERDESLPRSYAFELDASLDGDELRLAWSHPATDEARRCIARVVSALRRHASEAQPLASDLPPSALAAVLAAVRGNASDPVVE